jgi:hypothetical protein
LELAEVPRARVRPEKSVVAATPGAPWFELAMELSESDLMMAGLGSAIGSGAGAGAAGTGGTGATVGAAGADSV